MTPLASKAIGLGSDCFGCNSFKGNCFNSNCFDTEGTVDAEHI